MENLLLISIGLLLIAIGYLFFVNNRLRQQIKKLKIVNSELKFIVAFNRQDFRVYDNDAIGYCDINCVS